MPEEPVVYQTVEAEVQRLLDDLRGAAPDVVRAAAERLRELAEQVEDDRGRERALFRAGQLPKLLEGPSVPSSPQYRQAEALFGAAIGSAEPAEARIPQLEQTIQQISTLASQAPPGEAGAIRRLTSPLLRLLRHLRTASQ
jgi:hypothetical protein